MTCIPPVESVYYDAEVETMPRARLEELQLERLMDLLPVA
jgi:phenylacetate-coenzyme A ligase PaaK-like adenylate-forming protein